MKNIRSKITLIQNRVIKRIKKLSILEVFIFLTLIFIWIVLTDLFKVNNTWDFVRVEVVASDWKSTGNIYSSKAPFWLSESLEIGMSEKNFFGRKTAEVISIENYERGSQEAQIYIVVKLNSETNEQTGQKFYNGYPLLTGERIDFSFETVKVPGNILDTNYPPEGYKTETFEIEGVKHFLEPWEVEAVSVNDTMLSRNSGEEIAQILEVTSLPSQRRVVDLDNNGSELIVDSNQNKRDLHLKLRVKAQFIDGRWYFAGHQRLKVGEELWVYTDKIDLNEIEIKKVEPI